MVWTSLARSIAGAQYSGALVLTTDWRASSKIYVYCERSVYIQVRIFYILYIKKIAHGEIVKLFSDDQITKVRTHRQDNNKNSFIDRSQRNHLHRMQGIMRVPFVPSSEEQQERPRLRDLFRRNKPFKKGEIVEIHRGRYEANGMGEVDGNLSGPKIYVIPQGDRRRCLNKTSIRRLIDPTKLTVRFQEAMEDNPKIYMLYRELAEEFVKDRIHPSEVELENALLVAMLTKGE